MRIEIVLNGNPVELECEPLEMLMSVLWREGISSVRATCGIGVCGACTVLLDGRPTSGCLLLAAAADGREVTTVEGLGESDPVRQAFAEAHAFQCGWCTPGFVLTVKSLLEDDPEPTEEAMAEALGGNLCRCGSYVKILDAVRAASRAQAGGR